MGQFEKFGHYRTFACVMLVSWKNGRGKRAEPPQHRERPPGREEPGGLCVFHTMGRGAEPQGLFSFHPVLPHCTRARRAGPIRVVPRASYADGVALGAPENHNPLPRLGPFWKINLCGASEARLFSQKIQNFQGCFVTHLLKAGKAYPPLGVWAGKGAVKTRNRPRRRMTNRRSGTIRASGTKGGAAGGGEKEGRNGQTGAGSKAEKAPAALTAVPEWASTTAVAKLLGKTTRRIQQLTQDGVLETEVPPGGGARKYKTCETIQRYIAHIEQKAQETAAASSTAELNLRKLEAEVELKESQGQLHKLKTAIAEGKYIKAEEATRDLADFMAMFKKFAMNIPPRAVKSIAGYADPQTARAMERAMRKELEDMLAVFVDAAEIGPEEAEP